MNIRETVEKPRYGIDPYLDWLATEGIPVTEDYGVYLFDVPTAPWPRYGVKGAAVHLKGRGDFCQHVPARYCAGQIDDAAAPPLRRSRLRARRQRQHAARARRRKQAQLRMG